MRDGKVRVLHVITRLIRGGADENTVFTVEGMDPSVYESDILAGRGSEPGGFSPHIQQRTRILESLVRDPHPVLDVVALVRMVGIMRRGRYDLVHTHTAKAGFLGRLAARLAGIPHVVHTLHGVTFHDHIHPVARKVYVVLERFAARQCDVLITVGEDVKHKYIAESIGRREQYVTIPSGMDTRPFREALAHPDRTRDPRRRAYGFAPDDLVVGMVSRLEPRKGYVYLFEALARLAPEEPRLRALIVGEGRQRPELEALAASLGIADRIVFAGYREDVAETISVFDIAVLTSLWEGLPRVLVQYSLLEKPIVTFEVEGAREIVEDGVNGFVVAPKDVDALVDRLREVLRRPDLRDEFGRLSHERVEGRWDVDIMVAQIARVYADVGAAPPPRELETV